MITIIFLFLKNLMNDVLILIIFKLKYWFYCNFKFKLFIERINDKIYFVEKILFNFFLNEARILNKF